MLEEIRIRNLAVVEDTVLNFGDGLNVLTGETGAGKSMIVSAVTLVSGGRARKSLIRKGADSLSIEADFRVKEGWPYKEYLGMEADENILSIKRKISSDDRSRIWINGTSSTNRVAREVTGSLFELHGQHRHQELLDPEKHIDYLDSRGGYERLLAECRSKIEEYRSVRERLRKLREEEKENREKKDFIEYQYRELHKLGLERGLKDELESRISRSRNIHSYLSSLDRVRKLMENSDGGIIGDLSTAASEFAELTSIDRSWEEALGKIESIIMELNDILSSLDMSLEEDIDESEDLGNLQERIAGIQAAERKYGKSYEELIEYREKLKRILGGLENGSDEITETKWKLERIAGQLVPLLEELSSERRKNAASLDSEMTGQLRELGIEGAEFRTRINKIEIKSLSGEDDDIILPLRGWDDVEFMLRTNIGEEIKPLADIVSGGELSRVTLVMRSGIAAGRGIPTLIFDEIDTGLGADMGARISEKMIELSGGYQVICITHIPHIAAGAERHFVIRKKVIDRRTRSFADEIAGEERIDEIARMLGERKGLSRDLAEQLVREKSARSSVG